jgi:hypothetical protein
MLQRIIIWVMRFIFLGMIYVFLYKVIKVMYSDLKGGRKRKGLSAGIEVVEVKCDCQVPVGAIYPIRPVTSIGRMGDNNVVLESGYVSNHHARIYLKNNSFVLKDLGSTNGTYLNGNRIERPAVIKDDDLVGIGGIVFKVIG